MVKVKSIKFMYDIMMYLLLFVTILLACLSSLAPYLLLMIWHYAQNDVTLYGVG